MCQSLSKCKYMEKLSFWHKIFFYAVFTCLLITNELSLTKNNGLVLCAVYEFVYYNILIYLITEWYML